MYFSLDSSLQVSFWKIKKYADQALENDEITFKQLWESRRKMPLNLQEEG